MYVCTCVRMCACMDTWIHGYMDGRTDGRTDGWMAGCLCIYMFIMGLRVYGLVFRDQSLEI